MLRQHDRNLTMHHHNTLRHHLGKAMPRWRVEQLARRRAADRRVRRLPCWRQFVVLVFAQLAGSTSRRELVAALASHANHVDARRSVDRPWAKEQNHAGGRRHPGPDFDGSEGRREHRVTAAALGLIPRVPPKRQRLPP